MVLANGTALTTSSSSSSSSSSFLVVVATKSPPQPSRVLRCHAPSPAAQPGPRTHLCMVFLEGLFSWKRSPPSSTMSTC
jgi:hypothetical protein